ncbi:hypothetical protein GCM10028827_11840 [Mucilaginibacter myungsuensis]
MLGTAYPNESTLPPDSGKHSFDAALSELRSAVVTMGNLEGTLLDTGSPAPYKLRFIHKGYQFRMPTYYGKIIKDAGFDVLSLANNHNNDFNYQGRKSTIEVLDSLGINHGGQLTRPTSVFTVKGVKYGFVAFSPNAHVLPLLDLKNATRVISELRTRCDILIVSFHGGGEGTEYEHVIRDMELYMGEKRGDVYLFAHNAIDAGADMVLGNGPHVQRAMELYKDRIIAYSLGNFCTYRCVSVEGICGLSSVLKVKINRKGEFLSAKIHSFRQVRPYGLMRDTANRAAARIKYLTELDFPESGLSISPDGAVTALPKVVLAAVKQ